MTSANARKEILELVATGKISAAEAAALLSSGTDSTASSSVEAEASQPQIKVMAKAKADPAPPKATQIEIEVEDDSPAPKAAGELPNWFKVQVSDAATGKNKVSISIPLRVVQLGFKLGASFVPEMKGLNWTELQNLLVEASKGPLIEVQDSEDGEHVRIFLD